MKLLPIITLAAGLAVAGTPAMAAMDNGATMSQIRDAQTATFVQYDDAVGLPEVSADYSKAELQKWLGNNPSLVSEFETSNISPLDVDAAVWADGALKLYVNAADVQDEK